MTVTSRPPAGRARAIRAAPCASAMARTMARPSPCPSAVPGPRGVELLERLEQTVDLCRAGPAGRSCSRRSVAPAVARWRSPRRPGRPAMLWRSALSTRFATRLSTSRGSPGPRGAALERRLQRRRRHVGRPRTTAASDVGEVEGLAALHPLLAAGQRQQRLDEPLLCRAEARAPRWQVGSQRLQRRVRVGERDLQQRPLRGQRRPQLVRGVGHEVPLRRERRLQPLEQVVEGRRQLGELVSAAGRARAAGAGWSRRCRARSR